MRRNLRQSIVKSFGRYIAIAVIIALGAGIFVGLRSTRNDMVATGQIYMDEYNMFDLRLLCSYGWDDEQVERVRQLPDVEAAEGVFYVDLMVKQDAGADSVFRFYPIPETINRLSLRGGRMPERADECLADGYRNGDSILGTQITISDANEQDSLDLLKQKTFTVVGYVGTPLYMDMNRGSTSVGNGNISNYFFVPPDALDNSYYTEIHLTTPGEHHIYTTEYQDAMTELSDRLEPALEAIAQERLEQVRDEAEQEYADGYQKYLDGVKEYDDASQEAQEKFHDAFAEILDGEDQLRRSERQLANGELELQKARKTIQDNRIALVNARKQLANARKDANNQMNSAVADLKTTILNIAQEATAIEAELTPIRTELIRLDAEIVRLQLLVELGQAEYLPELEQRQAERNAKQAEKAALEGRQEAVTQQVRQLEEQLTNMVVQLAAAENQFAAADAQITAGEAQLVTFEKELDSQEDRIQEGWKELEQGKKDWDSGFREYMDARLETKQKLDDAKAELDDAKAELDDARKTIDDMTKNDLFVLDRTSNLGYSSLDSSSNIVAGVSRVFPAFFLLVAALVCITTMTRMVNEERTQIGTLKALGYSNAAIISKYLLYAGSSALLGCSLGVFAGSVVFPVILWEAYKIMIYITPQITLKIDWLLCSSVVLIYTAVMLLSTWYCCRRELKEVPAELIRPRLPTSGKPLLFEKWKLWDKLSFLNKVAIRNIFRYHQRLAMMLLGIGGCVALLMTGFGLRDSLMDLANIQFEEVVRYDLETYFQNGRTGEQQEAFRDELRACAEGILFFSQSSVDLDAENQTRSITMIVAPQEVTQYIDFHKGKDSLSYPGEDQVLITSGMAEILGLKIGDTVTLRNLDLEKLELTVSGIYDNHVYNYAIVSPQTIQKQWGRELGKQMAYVKLRPGQDPYAAGALISGLSGVMNVSINEEVAHTVDKMMEAMNMIIVVIVFCAGLLAVIVLYNLTNINVNERIREIATIKVLGFRAMETAMYVFKENMVLSLMGCAVGMLLGQLLLGFVISQIKIDMIWLETRLTAPSYIYSVLFTLLMGLLVDLVFYFRLDKINMAEALKSVE